MRTLIYLFYFIFTSSASFAQDQNRQKSVLAAKENALELLSQSIVSLEASKENDFHYFQQQGYDLVLKNANMAFVFLKENEDLQFIFPKQKWSPETLGCLEEQKKADQEKQNQHSSNHHNHHLHDQKNPKSEKILAFVDASSDTTINLCHAFFDFPPKRNPAPLDLETKVFAQAQIIIHETTHLVQNHTKKGHLTFAQKETEASWYTYESMIFGTGQLFLQGLEIGHFFEDAYYMMFGFNNPIYTYRDRMYGDRYRVRVIR